MSHVRPKRSYSIAGLIVALSLIFAGSASAMVTWEDISDPAKLMAKLTQKKCADGFRFSMSGPTAYCLKSKIALPSKKLSSSCDDIKTGTLSFSWKASKKSASYQCPEGSTLTKKKGMSHCIFEGLIIPKELKNLQPYCQYISKGYFGYSYSL